MHQRSAETDFEVLNQQTRTKRNAKRRIRLTAPRELVGNVIKRKIKKKCDDLCVKVNEWIIYSHWRWIESVYMIDVTYSPFRVEAFFSTTFCHSFPSVFLLLILLLFAFYCCACVLNIAMNKALRFLFLWMEAVGKYIIRTPKWIFE